MAQLDGFNDRAGYWTSPDWQAALDAAGIGGRTSGAIRNAIAKGGGGISNDDVVQALVTNIGSKLFITPVVPPAGTPYLEVIGAYADAIGAVVETLNLYYQQLNGGIQYASNTEAALTGLNPTVNNLLNQSLGAFVAAFPTATQPNSVMERIQPVANDLFAWSATWRPWAAADTQLQSALMGTAASCSLTTASQTEATGNWAP